MSAAGAILLAAMTSAEAIATLLNTASASGAAKFAEAKAQVEREAAAGGALQRFVVAVTTDDRDLRARYLESAGPAVSQMAKLRGNPLAWYLLSVESNDCAMLARAAEGGNVQALNALGTLAAASGANLPPEILAGETAPVRAYRCFRAAALQRDPNGLVNVGLCYLGGLGCAANARLAYECFAAAAKMGHPEAMDHLADACERGIGTEADLRLSTQWKMRARAARGDRAAEKWLEGGR